MTYPIQFAERALDRIDTALYAMRSYLSEAITVMAAGNVSIDYVLSIHNSLENTQNTLTANKSVPGLAAYAQRIKGDNNLNVATEFTTVETEIANAKTWMVNNLPKESATGQGWLHYMRFDGSGNLVKATFTPAQTAQFRTVLQTLVNTVSV